MYIKDRQENTSTHNLRMHELLKAISWNKKFDWLKNGTRSQGFKVKASSIS